MEKFPARAKNLSAYPRRGRDGGEEEWSWKEEEEVEQEETCKSFQKGVKFPSEPRRGRWSDLSQQIRALAVKWSTNWRGGLEVRPVRMPLWQFGQERTVVGIKQRLIELNGTISAALREHRWPAVPGLVETRRKAPGQSVPLIPELPEAAEGHCSPRWEGGQGERGYSQVSRTLNSMCFCSSNLCLCFLRDY